MEGEEVICFETTYKVMLLKNFIIQFKDLESISRLFVTYSDNVYVDISILTILKICLVRGRWKEIERRENIFITWCLVHFLRCLVHFLRYE